MGSTIPPWELLGMLNDDEVVVVDCRPREEWGQKPVQIPGSLRMALEEILDAPGALPDDELIVLVDGADGAHARKAWRALLMSGRTAVCLRGGLNGWLSHGLPTERILWHVELAGVHP
jgi:rhodanese-related sulfurtransferase